MSQFFEPGAPAPAGDARPVFDWARLAAEPAPQGWSAPEAFFAILIAAATCDGELSRIEHEVLLALVHRSRAIRAMSSEEVTDLNVRVVRKLQQAPQTALEDACRALPQEMRLPTFAQALDIILADGDLSQREAATLNALAAYLELSAADVERVAAVLILKNRV